MMAAERVPERGARLGEAADVLFHVMVGLVARKLSIDSVLDELGRRFGTSGHVEKASRQK